MAKAKQADPKPSGNEAQQIDKEVIDKKLDDLEKKIQEVLDILNSVAGQ